METRLQLGPYLAVLARAFALRRGGHRRLYALDGYLGPAVSPDADRRRGEGRSTRAPRRRSPRSLVRKGRGVSSFDPRWAGVLRDYSRSVRRSRRIARASRGV